jgi:hypothetical protein
VQISFTRHRELPKLGWVATVHPRFGKLSVALGDWVETLDDGFIEGVADTEFSSNLFDQTACVFGSGAVVRDDCVTFVSSTATTDYLYWAKIDDGNAVLVANSLPLLLANLDDRLDPSYLDYAQVNHSIIHGINRYRPQIATAKATVNRLIFRNLRVSANEITLVYKPLAPRFSGYSDYLGYLTSCYERIVKNARDSRRERPMAIFSTQSRGYDSTAINAIAKDYGVDRVFTVSKGKARGLLATQDGHIDVNDDGTEICEKFALPCVQIDRRALENDSENEALFYATIEDNGDFNLQQISSHITQPTILLTGALGELWYPASYSDDKPGSINADLVRGDLSTHGLTEVRIEAGYVQLALPYVGATSREDILRITESPEMDRWRLRTAYDRPIPRRIAEDAGLAREMFGQIKMASVLEYPTPRIPVNVVLRDAYFSFLVENRLLARWQLNLLPMILKWNTIVTTTSPKYYVWNYYLERAISRIVGKPFNFPALWQYLNGSIFCFCVNRRVDELRKRLNL